MYCSVCNAIRQPPSTLRRSCWEPRLLALRHPIRSVLGLVVAGDGGKAVSCALVRSFVVLLPRPELTYNMIGDSIYAFPRHDGLLLDRTEQRDVWASPPQNEVSPSRNYLTLRRPPTGPARSRGPRTGSGPSRRVLTGEAALLRMLPKAMHNAETSARWQLWGGPMAVILYERRFF
jgi:hypothetical protein